MRLTPCRHKFQEDQRLKSAEQTGGLGRGKGQNFRDGAKSSKKLGGKADACLPHTCTRD